MRRIKPRRLVRLRSYVEIACCIATGPLLSTVVTLACIWIHAYDGGMKRGILPTERVLLDRFDDLAVAGHSRHTFGATTVFLQDCGAPSDGSRSGEMVMPSDKRVALAEAAPHWAELIPHADTKLDKHISTRTDAAGWPARMVRCSWVFNVSDAYEATSVSKELSTTTVSTRIHLDLQIGSFSIPYGPIWSGLALNILFYGGIAFALVRGPKSLRRWRRRKRGRCIRCNYDRAGLDASLPCPECGGGA